MNPDPLMIDNIYQKIYLYKCDFCKKKYKSKKGYKNHKCKHFYKKIDKEKGNEELKDKDFEELMVQNELLKKIITAPPSVVNNNITNIQNNNQHLYLVNNNFSLFGEEKVNHITKEMFLKILNQTDINDVYSDLLRLIYFNKEVPQNNRWCVLYAKEEFGALQYNKKTDKIERWVTEEVVDRNFEMMINSIQPMMDGLQESELNTVQKRNLNILYCHYGRKRISQYEPHNFRKIKMLAFNNKDTPLKLWLKKGLPLPDDKITL